jgi:hypothetical protein
VSDLQKLKETIILTASYYQKSIAPQVLEMYVEDLIDLQIDEVINAYRSYRRNPKNKFFPLPGQIREIVAPEKSPEAEGREIVENIKRAVAEFGYMRTSEALTFIGPVGAQIVRSMGGWSRVCESDFLYNSSLLAQARNRAEDLVKFGDSGSKFLKLTPPENSDEFLIEDKKVMALKNYEDRLASKEQKKDELVISFPPQEEREQMIKDLLEKVRLKQLAEGDE